LVVHNGLHNLIWLWTAAVPGFGPNGNGPLQDFFPGLLYVDALSVDQDNLNPRWRMDAALGVLGVGKVMGVDLTSVPSLDVLLNQKWAWFLISLDDAGSPERSQTLQLLYKDPRILERAESEAHASAK